MAKWFEQTINADLASEDFLPVWVKCGDAEFEDQVVTPASIAKYVASVVGQVIGGSGAPTDPPPYPAYRAVWTDDDTGRIYAWNPTSETWL